MKTYFIPKISFNIHLFSKAKIIIAFLLLFNQKSFSQKEIGFTIGSGVGTFFDLNFRDYYEAKYTFNNENSFSLFYEAPHKKNRLKSEIQYEFLKGTIDGYNDEGYSTTSYYQNYSLKLQQFKLNLFYVFGKPSENKLHCDYFVGGSLYFNTIKKLRGNGWYGILQNNPYDNLDKVNYIDWSVDEKSSGRITNIGLFINFGFDFKYQINDKLRLSLINKYSLSFSPIFKNFSLGKITPYAFTNLSIGIARKIGGN